jgi:hypothetical protein
MTDLSPAAQAVWNAYLDNSEWDASQCELDAIAAALRAAADQVVPGINYQLIFTGKNTEQNCEKQQLIRRRIYDIADELGGIKPQSETLVANTAAELKAQ